MPAPTQLAIATSSVLRLLKEEISYRKELVEGETRVNVLEENIKNGQVDEDGNAAFLLQQQKTAVEQTKAVFEPLKKKIADAVLRLEEMIALSEASGEDVEQAKLVLEQAKTTQNAAS